jgi:radical SAM superfamily enzyme
MFYRGKISLQIRLELLTAEFLDIVKRMNTNGAYVILEGGIQTTNTIEMIAISRSNDLLKIREKMAMARQRNIEVEVSLIYGLPYSTVDTFTKSIQFCKEIGAIKIRAWPLMLLKGTDLFVRRAEWGFDEEFDEDHIPHVVSSNSFTKNDMDLMK